MAARSRSRAGTIEPWGLTNMSPAMLVGSPTESLLELPKTLRAMTLDDVVAE